MQPSNEQRVERKLAAIFAADVAGYSRLMGQDEVGTLRTLAAYREIMDRLIAEHRGRIANTAGDSVLAEFPSVVDAVQCAVEVQKAIHKANEVAREDRRMSFRIGVHVGDVIIRGGDLLGDGVNIAARLQELAPAGGLCISAEAHQYVRRTLPLEFTDMGEQSVKNVGALRTYEVRGIEEHAYEPHPGTSKPFPLPDKPSIAVLPFINLSGPDDEYFCDGIVEEIVTALSRVKSFFVIARNSSFTYKGRTVDVKQVGRDLGVRYILEGSVRRARDRLRISGQLVDAIQGTHIWADRYDGSVEEIFELQDQITSRVVGAIEPKLKQHEIERSRQKPTENLAAYDLYLKASWQLALLTRDGNEEALRLCREARKLDPLYARALALEAWCYLWRRAEGWVENVEEEAREGVRLARGAIAADREDPIVLTYAGHALAYLGREYDTGLAYVEKAFSLNPNSAAAHEVAGWIMLYRSESLPAIERFQRALRLSPLDPNAGASCAGVALAHAFLGEWEDAVDWGRRALQESPSFTSGHRALVAGLVRTGRVNEASK